MDFSKFSQFNEPENDSLENFEIISLNQQAQDELFSILDDKKFDCKTKEAKRLISENMVFVTFIKKTLQPLDPASKKLSNTLLKILICDFMENSYASSKEMSKNLPKYQLEFIVVKSKMPKDMQNELDNTISYYLEQYPDSYPYVKLVGFIKSKHKTIQQFLSNDRIRDYISLTFIVTNSQENFSFASYELKKKLESQKTVLDIFNEISKSLEYKINSVENKLGKLSVLGEFYDNFLLAYSELQKQHKKIGNKVLIHINKFLLEQVLPKLSISENGESEQAKLLLEEEIKEKILRQQLQHLKYYTEKSQKYYNYQKEIQDLSESELTLKQNSIKSQILSSFGPNTHEALAECLLSSSKDRQKILESVAIKTQELQYLNSIQDLKIQKTKKLFNVPKSISELLRSDFLKTEEALYRKNRDLTMQVKLFTNENQKILEKLNSYESSPSPSYPLVYYLEILLLTLFFFILGIVAQSLCGYFKLLEILL